MQYRWLAPLAVSLSFLVTGAQAQLRGRAGGNVGNVHIHIVLSNDRNAGPYLLVHLMEGSGDAVVATTYTNDIGQADFMGVAVGYYHVQVSGDGIETTSSDTFEVDNRKVTQAQYVVVRKLEDSGPRPVSAHSGMVSATDLNVPAKARKELDKANESMATQNWKKAKEHLDKAIALAPQYATAYNNLGVLYAKTNDLPHEEEALKKAISLDEHFAPALVNYGKLSLRQKNFPQAETLLQRAVAVEPDNPESLMLLADAQYMDRHFDAAITSALQAHSAAHEHPSFVHYIAARAYQQENRQQDALAQFQEFLKEEPKGPRADHVRADIARIQSATQQAAQ
ncbi:MAG TPA: tetratricopeptide repeat protein [Candidatus Binatia bacterium]|nr:tetratricopeptide repeat protein [Candidatus Binatia bacterium]